MTISKNKTLSAAKSAKNDEFYTQYADIQKVANGSITNSPVFSYGGTPLNNRNASQDDIWLSLAKYVPAISSPIGGMAALGLEDHNLNGTSYRDGWGRQDNVYNQNWLHSDMKDMAFFYVYPLYNELVQKGMMK